MCVSVFERERKMCVRNGYVSERKSVGSLAGEGRGKDRVRKLVPERESALCFIRICLCACVLS